MAEEDVTVRWTAKRKVRSGEKGSKRARDKVTIADDSPQASAACRNWARFIKKIYEVDPILCPECGGAMRIIAFIDEPTVIRRHPRCRSKTT